MDCAAAASEDGLLDIRNRANQRGYPGLDISGHVVLRKGTIRLPQKSGYDGVILILYWDLKRL
jgi:hypothetical protein